MTRNGFLALCIVTAVTVILAVVSVLHEPRMSAANVAGDPVFPNLAQKLADLKTVVVKDANGDFTFDWTGKNWVSRDRKNYPADDQKVDALVLQMARLVKLEAKTAAPDKLDRLDLNDPNAKDSRAKEIVLLNHEGKTIADLIVGKRKLSLGGKEGGTYVRLPGGSQSWLALGDLDPGTKLRDWLKRDIVDVKPTEVKRVTVVHPDGEKIVAGRLSASDVNFKVENLPAGKQPASDYVGDDFSRILAGLQIDDVAPADDVPFAKDKTTTADVDTLGGLHIALQLTEKDGNAWVKLTADASASATLLSKPETDSKLGAATAAIAGPDWSKVANDINKRSNGWAFQVPTYEVAVLNKHMADLIKKPGPKS